MARWFKLILYSLFRIFIRVLELLNYFHCFLKNQSNIVVNFCTSSTDSIFCLFIQCYKLKRFVIHCGRALQTLIEIYYMLIDFANFQLLSIENDVNSYNCWEMLSKCRVTNGNFSQSWDESLKLNQQT